jgi:hypothetical protein
MAVYLMIKSVLALTKRISRLTSQTYFSLCDSRSKVSINITAEEKYQRYGIDAIRNE